MSLFQKSVIKKYLSNLDPKEVNSAYNKFREFYGDSERIENIKLLKEENYQEGFLREIFVQVLGYTINPDKNFNLTTEFKNETDSKKADGAILQDGKAIGVIELKSTKTVNLESITTQAFNYKNHQNKCRFVITSNFEKLNFYIDNATEWEEFNLFTLTENDFKLFYFLLNCKNILAGIPLKVKEESRLHEENISDKLYKDYSQFKHRIYNNLVKNNPQFDKLSLFKSSQKLLDRILFILFAEDSLLVPPNSITRIVDQWKQLKSLDEAKPLYTRFVKFFNHLNVGHTYEEYSLPAYNGGLFQEDEILDNVKIDDEILLTDIIKLSSYDFSSEVDVNILGHIFEHSLSEIEELTAELEGNLVEREKSKRKKDGIFYTPKYITKYIVDNTIGSLCAEKKKELNLNEIDETILESSRTQKGKLNQKAKILFDNLDKYREYILSLKILDPACGSGAFLNQALEFLIKEHKWIDEHKSSLLKEAFTISEYEKDIVENNIYGVDINEEAVEIAKLSLWLRTAKKGRKLSTLSNNIKCGNSLIDDPKVAGNKAFNWNEEFKEIMHNGGFDVVIGNPPYVNFANLENNVRTYYREKYKVYKNKTDLYAFFIERTEQLLNNKGKLSFIIPHTWLATTSFQPLRKLLLKQLFLDKIVELDFGVFRDAIVKTVIIRCCRTKPEFIFVYDKIFESKIKIPISKIFVDTENKINLDWNDRKQKVFDKIFFNSTRLDNYIKFTRGIKTSNDSRFLSQNKTNEDYKKVLRGRNIKAYRIDYNNEYIWYRPDLMKEKIGSLPHNKELFETNEKLITQRVNSSGQLLVAYDNEKYYCLDTTNVSIVQNKEINLKTILVILNSKLINWWFSDIFKMPTISGYELHQIPIHNPKNEKVFVETSTKMLLLSKKKKELVEKFINRTVDIFELENISKKIESFYEFEFSQFRKELIKQKVEISLKHQDEWEEYFNEYKTKINQLQEEITKTDNEIDVMVYKLYNLTYEEVKIVDPQFWMSEEIYKRIIY